jgi:excisionase family DNA binding protein
MGDRMPVKAAAEKLGISERLVVRYINQKRLKAERFGRSWAIDPTDLATFAAQPREWGGYRPRKTARQTGKGRK